MDLSKKTARLRAKIGKLYPVPIGKSLFLCYRRSKRGGTWTAKLKRPGEGFKYDYERLGEAEDSEWTRTLNPLSYDAAIEAARKWALSKAPQLSGQIIPGPYPLSQVLDDYLDDLKMRKEGDHSQTVSIIESKLKPALGSVQLTKLHTKQIEDWFYGLVKAGNSKATANRNLTVMCAALNFAYQKNRIATKAVWDKIQKFKGVEKARARFLTIDECKRLIAVCSEDFRALVRAALYTGCRYGELTAMCVDAFSASNNSIHIPKSKSGKPRTIALTKEGAAFFSKLIANKADNDLMFTHSRGRHKGEGWERTQQTFHMKVACEAAKISPPCGFHVLRHSYASHLKMNHTDSFIIAAQLGHRDTRMVELHYQHLEDGHIADEIRSKLPNLGYIVPAKKQRGNLLRMASV